MSNSKIVVVSVGVALLLLLRFVKGF